MSFYSIRGESKMLERGKSLASSSERARALIFEIRRSCGRELSCQNCNKRLKKKILPSFTQPAADLHKA